MHRLSVRSGIHARRMAGTPVTAPGELCRRGDVPTSPGYAVFDCETTGTDPERDEIVSLALVLLDPDGKKTVRFGSLIRPSRPIPEEASAIHRIRDADVADAPTFAELAGQLIVLLGSRVFVAHNASFDLAMLALGSPDCRSRVPPTRSCLHARRLPRTRTARPGAPARSDLRAARHPARRRTRRDARRRSNGSPRQRAPRPRSRAGIGTTRPRCLHATANPRRYPPGLRATSPPRLRPGSRRRAHRFRRGRAERGKVCELILRVAGIDEPDRLTREQVQDVYDELERLITENEQRAA